jgi:hypothetical protein
MGKSKKKILYHCMKVTHFQRAGLFSTVLGRFFCRKNATKNNFIFSGFFLPTEMMRYFLATLATENKELVPGVQLKNNGIIVSKFYLNPMPHHK